jgi:transglutaminase-like putative cysteine protease
MSCYINGTKVGYTHTVIEPITEDGSARLRFTYDDELVLKRFNADTTVRTKLTSLETVAGEVLSFRSELKTGPGSIETEGRQADGKLILRTTTQGRTEEQTLRLDQACGGFFADQQSLRETPLKPGQTRRVRALLPVIHQVGEIRMEAVAYEATPLLSGSRQLLRINVTTDLGSTEMKSVLWSDGEGNVWRVRDLQLNMEVYKTTRDQALTANQGGSFDIGFDTIVRLAQPIKDAHRTKRIVYRARLKEGDIHALLADGGTQTVKMLDERTAEVTVQAVRPTTEQAAETPDAERPTPADSSASSLLQTDDPAVADMARRVLPDEADAWKVACALERHVKDTIRLKNYSTAMATAAEVAKSLEGDCTEHAMLLAALCRVRKIPARVAVGVVYYPAGAGFAYHMWTEVWVKDRWIPLDATLGLGGIGAAHVKFTDSSLQGLTAYAELLPVVHALGRLELEILSVEH